jgi:hypothetical protein
MSMTRDEMLRRMGLKDGKELDDLLEAYRNFHKGLSPGQQGVLSRSLPSIEDAAKSFGPDVTPKDLQDLFDPTSSGAMFSMFVAVVATSHKPKK